MHYNITVSQWKILTYALGLDAYGRGEINRNDYVTYTKSYRGEECMQLVQMGLLTCEPADKAIIGDAQFRVTPKGIEYVRRRSQSFEGTK